MILRGRTMFDPCLGDADTHAPHMCPFPTGEGSSTSFVQGVTLFNTALLDERLPKAQFNFVLEKIKHFASLLLRVAKRREGNE